MLKRKSRLENREKTFKDFLQITEETERIRKEKEYRTSLRQVMAFIASETDQLVAQRWKISDQLDDGKTNDLFKEKNKLSSKIDRLHRLRNLINNCEKKFIAFSRINKDEVRESYGMPLTCGSMLCPRCSQKKSKVHNRKVYRIARWMLEIRDQNGDKQPFHSVVFTLPLKLRKHFASEKMLNVLFKSANEALKEVVGPEGCVLSMHFFGDKSDEFNPHVNCVFSGISAEGRLPLPTLLSKSELKKLRETFLAEVLKSVPCAVKDELFDDGDVGGENFIEQHANCHRSIRFTEGQKKHNLLYIFRGTLPLRKLEIASQKVKDLFLFDLSPSKDGFAKGSRGRGFRNVRYFGAYRCSNRKKYLEENGIVVPTNAGFQTRDDDIKFEVVFYKGKPKIFSFNDVDIIIGELHLELRWSEIYLDDSWEDDHD